jgi:hypothetical protein
VVNHKIVFDDENLTATVVSEIIEPTAADIKAALERARALVEQGWCKGQAADGNSFCLVGALAEATLTAAVGVQGLPGYKVWRDARQALEDEVPKTYPSLVAFNDRTSQAEVLDLVDRAIAAVTE